MNDITLRKLEAGDFSTPSLKDNSSAALSGSGINFLQKVTNITGAGGSTTLSHDDSGTLFIVDCQTAAHTFTLPALKAGFNMKIIMAVATQDNDLVVTAPGDNMITYTKHDDADGDAANKIVTDTFTTVTINADTVAAVGTRVEIYCDGTNYFYIGTSNTQSDSHVFVGS
tara:strand:- start:10 stop:519 length:510 start_codon:yes stop_codon:yes gene_type:complete